jgi:hypothetical protein
VIRNRRVEYLLLDIVRYVDDCQPGVVACEFRDSDGHLHTVIDKVPIFKSKLLEPDSHALRSVLLDVKSCSPFKIKLQASVAWTG